MMSKPKICFYSELGFESKVLRTHFNMRTEMAWIAALDANHYSIYNIDVRRIEDHDLAIIILPKKGNYTVLSKTVHTISKKAKKIAIMQEGPVWFFQDYEVNDQVLYYNILRSADIIFAHNIQDVRYYKGLLGKEEVTVMPSLMIHDAMPKLSNVARKSTIIGGNFVSWYGGFDSNIVASSIPEEVVAVSMGRKQKDEEYIVSSHLPYLSWRDWIETLNTFKYAVHLMRTYAAGTFALNCAALGIPCIGYEYLDTQRLCHPELTVKEGDLLEAQRLLKLLHSDENFYRRCSEEALKNYNKHFHEEVFLKKFYQYLEHED